MELINTPNNLFVDQDPSKLQAGTPIPASTMNALQNEISNVITGYGLTIDPTNSAQMKAALEVHFAPLASPSLTGVPVTVQPGTSSPANQIATIDYVNQKALAATVGFVPVEQSGGTGMGTNKIYIGQMTDGSGLSAQIDSGSPAKFVFQEEDTNTYGISTIGYDHTTSCVKVYDTGNKLYHNLVDFEYMNEKNFVPSIPTGNNQEVVNLVWNTSSNLPAYYYGSNDTVSYSATTDWVSENYLALAGGTITGTLTAVTPETTDNSTNVATTAYVQNQQYIESVISSGSTNVIVKNIVRDVSDNLIVTFSDGTTQDYLPGSAGEDENGNYWRKTGNLLEQWFEVKQATTGNINYPISYPSGVTPKVFPSTTQEVGHSSVWPDIGQNGGAALISNTGFTIALAAQNQGSGWSINRTGYNVTIFVYVIGTFY